MAQLPNLNLDPTLEEMNKQLVLKQNLERSRNYLGASSIGHDCRRHLFYSFRGCEKRTIQASGIKAIEDGYDQEEKTIARLRAVNGLSIYNDDGNGNQIGFRMLLGHFCGHVDGVVTGLLQSPKTPHVFEHKAVNETKFNKLKKLINDKGEKNALEEWDSIYYAQCQIYCHALELERHYTVVSTPGGRDHTSCRTDYNKQYAENIIEKAQSIIFDNWSIPAKLSDKREFYKCKWCDYSEICHDGKFPLVHCKTCQYSEPVRDGRRKCHWKDELIDEAHLNLAGCAYHLYNPALIDAKLVEQKNDYCIYETANNSLFANCILSGMPPLDIDIVDMYTSKDLYSKIQFVGNIKKELLRVQKKFDGSFQEKSPAKLWETKKDAKLFDI